MFAMLALLTQGVLAFDAEDLERLKATGSCRGCDLSGADLHGLNLVGADLRGADSLFYCESSG
jgi:uncharacterized protein YjbI with pentapeptide repeats